MGTAILTHLQASTRAEASLDASARIRLLRRDRWIDYPRASQALLKLESLLEMPPKARMPCMVLHGDSNIGKTLIVSKFQREHPDRFDEVKGVERRDVIVMQMPATPDQHRFYSALLFELGAPHSASASLSVLERLARELLRRIAPRMLVVDEVHHLLAGTYREQRSSLNLLKFLANDLKFSIVVVGTADAPLALASDPQMISRFTPFEMPRWRESDDLRRLLGAFERVLPLRKPSDLMQRPIAQFILVASGGLTGDISRLLNEAAALAILDGSEQITLAHLEHVALADQ
ncbi:TniB family NTP-binding protein [Variovorax robiniae]|uniref:TniB family NTP-binding protein n=1 Tax=Variovorax robiniae TaxID=1836199 RepID=A0ABU8XKB3_9BURK